MEFIWNKNDGSYYRAANVYLAQGNSKSFVSKAVNKHLFISCRQGSIR